MCLFLYNLNITVGFTLLLETARLKEIGSSQRVTLRTHRRQWRDVDAID